MRNVSQTCYTLTCCTKQGVVHRMQATRSAPSCKTGCFCIKLYQKLKRFVKKLVLNESGPPAYAEFEYNKEFEIESVQKVVLSDEEKKFYTMVTELNY